MKTKFLSLLLLLGLGAVTHAEAQRPAGDIVYLRDGSVLRGTIVQMSPNRPVQVVTSDGRTFILKRSDILRFTHGELAQDKPVSQSYWFPGYLGLQLCPTYSPDYEGKGVSASLDFGYLLTDNIGISSSARVSLLQKYKNDTEMRVLGMKFHLGPLFSFRTSRRGSIGITPMAGISRLHYGQKVVQWKTESTPFRFSWEVGVQYRHRIGRRVDLITGVHYNYTRGHDEIGAGIGVAFKLD